MNVLISRAIMSWDTRPNLYILQILFTDNCKFDRLSGIRF